MKVNHSYKEKRAISSDFNQYNRNGDDLEMINQNNVSFNNYQQNEESGYESNQYINNYSSNNNDFYAKGTQQNGYQQYNSNRINSANYNQVNRSGLSGQIMNQSRGSERQKKEPIKISYQPISSLAEENLVKNFNKLNPKNKINEQYLQTNKPQRIELPLFFNTPIRFNDSTLNTKVKSRSLYQKNYNTLGCLPENSQLGATKLNYSFNQFSQFNQDHNTIIKNPIDVISSFLVLFQSNRVISENQYLFR